MILWYIATLLFVLGVALALCEGLADFIVFSLYASAIVTLIYAGAGVFNG